MIVQTRKLNTGDLEGYQYSEEAEAALSDLVFNCGFTVTEGYNPYYDVVLDTGETIEIKFTNRYDIFIEESYYDGTPSGISITEADYYLIVLKGKYPDGKETGKVKLIPTEKLREVASKCKRKSYSPGSTSPGSRGFVLSQELGQDDGWLGNVGYYDGFDLKKWTYKR